MCELVKPSFVSFEDNTFVIHHFPYIVDFRSAMWLPYEHWSVANIDTRSAPMFLVARVFFPLAPCQA